MPVSVANIAKHEVLTLRKTIETVRPFVNKVVIGLDEDSTDGTDVIAKELADIIIPTRLSKELAAKGPVDPGIADWGFSRARNLVFDSCPAADWRLVLDGHETIKEPDRIEYLIESAKKHGCDSIEVTIYFEPDRDGIPTLIYPQVRIIDPTVRYSNPIHNIPLVNKVFIARDFIIVHEKSKQESASRASRDRQRSDANIEGLKKRTEETPLDSRSWFYFATALKESGRWSESISAFKSYLKVSRWDEERWHARVGQGFCYEQLGDIDNARSEYSAAIDEFPTYCEAYYYLGCLAYNAGRWNEARVWLEECCSMPFPPSSRLFVTPRIYMFARYDKLSMVYHHLGRYKDAIDIASEALKSAPSERIDKNISFWKSQTAQKTA